MNNEVDLARGWLVKAASDIMCRDNNVGGVMQIASGYRPRNDAAPP